MKILNLLLVTLLLTFGFQTFAGDDWLTDFEKAKKEAKAKNLPILADFAGSDWCSYCKKLDKEVFSKDEFKEFAAKNIVLFLADFPRSKQLGKEVKKQNVELAKKYGVQGFPTVLLLDSEGKKLAQTGYRPGGAEAYVKHLKQIIKDAKKK